METTCQFCGRPCSKFTSSGEVRKYCSVSCAGKAMRKRPEKMTTCLKCGREMPAYGTNGRERTYCSVECDLKDRQSDARRAKSRRDDPGIWRPDCPHGHTEMECLDLYLNANVYRLTDSTCWRCRVGKKNRVTFSEEVA